MSLRLPPMAAGVGDLSQILVTPCTRTNKNLLEMVRCLFKFHHFPLQFVLFSRLYLTFLYSGAKFKVRYLNQITTTCLFERKTLFLMFLVYFLLQPFYCIDFQCYLRIQMFPMSFFKHALQVRETAVQFFFPLCYIVAPSVTRMHNSSLSGGVTLSFGSFKFS